MLVLLDCSTASNIVDQTLFYWRDRVLLNTSNWVPLLYAFLEVLSCTGIVSLLCLERNAMRIYPFANFIYKQCRQNYLVSLWTRLWVWNIIHIDLLIKRIACLIRFWRILTVRGIAYINILIFYHINLMANRGTYCIVRICRMYKV